MSSKVLKTADDHRAALEEAESLIALDPEAGSNEADRLELLTLLLQDYERKTYKFDAVDAVDAIEFRMAEQGLRQKDLVPYIGSRSRVSEVLARKRPLTVQMIRELSAGLGIPAELLIASNSSSTTPPVQEVSELDWAQFPYREMERRGWFEAAKVAGASTEDRLRAFISQLMPRGAAPVLFRRRFVGTEKSGRSYYSTLAWTARVLQRARDLEPNLAEFHVDKLNADSMKDLGRLSWFENGPSLALEYLSKCGIAVIVEPKLPEAVFDGAAMLSEKRRPVIGLTMRIDRVDYFWFTLMHEVAHVWKHLNDASEAFVDRLEEVGASREDAREQEAHRLARDAFIKRVVWERSAVRTSPSKENIQELADSLHIHPAIIVGRLQFETGQYEKFREFLGQGKVLTQLSAR